MFLVFIYFYNTFVLYFQYSTVVNTVVLLCALQINWNRNFKLLPYLQNKVQFAGFCNI